MKIAINTCYGVFCLSKKAIAMLGEDKYFEIFNKDLGESRTDERLISAIEVLGKEANGSMAQLAIAEIPDDITDFMISENDGYETVLYVKNGKIKKYLGE